MKKSFPIIKIAIAIAELKQKQGHAEEERRQLDIAQSALQQYCMMRMSRKITEAAK